MMPLMSPVWLTLYQLNFNPARQIYVSWIVPEVRDNVTLVRNGSVFPWPLNHYQNWRKRRHFQQLLTVFEWHSLTLDEVLEKVRRCCETLTDLLANKEFFFGTT